MGYKALKPLRTHKTIPTLPDCALTTATTVAVNDAVTFDSVYPNLSILIQQGVIGWDGSGTPIYIALEPAETPVGSPNGFNKTFGLSATGAMAMSLLFDNGLVDSTAGTTETSATLGPAAIVPLSDDTVIVAYPYVDTVLPEYTWQPVETIAGTKDGSNLSFTIANSAIGNRGLLHYNGVTYNSGFTVSGTSITLTTLPAPASTDELTFTYKYSTPGYPPLNFMFNEALTGSKNDSNKVFTTSVTPAGNKAIVELSGFVISDFTIVGNLVTLGSTVPAPNTLDTLTISYQYANFGGEDTDVAATIPGGRLTLTAGTPVTTSDVTAATTLYYTSYMHGYIPLYYGGTWYNYAIGSPSLKLTDTQTGTTTNASAAIIGLTDTSQLVRGMEVSGAGISGGTTIAAITSATTLTLSANATASASVSLTFKLAASTLYDVFPVPTSTSAYRLQFGLAWTSSAAGSSSRNIDVTYANAQDGALVNDTVIASGDSNSIAAKGGRYLGTIMTTITAGQTEDSMLRRLVQNFHNRVDAEFTVAPGYGVAPYSTTSTTWVVANSGTNATGGLISIDSSAVALNLPGHTYNNTTNPSSFAIGLNSSSSAAASQQAFQPTAGGSYPASAGTTIRPAIGYNTISLLIITGGGGQTSTFYPDGPAGGASGGRLTHITGIVRK